MPKLSTIIYSVLILTLACKPKVREDSTTHNLKISQAGISLFDGKSFKGWEGPKDFFRIEDESIVAGSLSRDIPMNQFLCTLKSYGDFDLKMKVKFISKDNNAGIQIRSQRIPNNHEVIGYQADIGFLNGKPLWGSLYDESRRNKFMMESDSTVVMDVLKLSTWNDYHIICKGPNVNVFLNGTQVLNYTELDDSLDQSGKICVQIHGGVPAEAWYKDIKIKVLN